MKFEEIHIDGFGIFHDYSIRDLSPGLTIITGPNEAGKSTVLAFMRRVLFGFPDRRSKVNIYPPLAGGRHGGRLSLRTNDNEKRTVERYADKSQDVRVLLPDGSTRGPDELSRLLGHANRDVFENVYAFGLTELQDFQTLNSEAVKGRIYSAGAGMSAISLSEVQKGLESEAGSLFKERGRNPEINVLFAEIRNINSNIQEIEKDAQRFDELHRELDEVTGDIERVKKERDERQTRLNHIGSLIGTWDDWRVIEDSTARLKGIPEIESFPENGIAIVDNSLEKIEEMKDGISNRNEELKKIEIEKSLIEIDEKLISNREEITEIQTDKGKYGSATKDLPTLRRDLERQKETLKTSLHEIGPDWDEKRLSQFDTSIPSREAVRKKRDSINEVREGIRDTEKDCQRTIENVKKLEKGIDEVDKDIKSQSIGRIDEQELKQQRKALGAIRARYPELKEKEAVIHGLEEKEELFDAFKPRRIEPTAKLPVWPAVVLAVAGIISLVLFALEDNWVSGVILLSLLIFSAILYIILGRKAPSPAILDGTESREAKDLIMKSTTLAKRKEKGELELKTIRNEMVSNARTCGFENIPDTQAIESRDSELQALAIQSRALRELTKQRESLEKDLRESDRDAEDLKRRLEESKGIEEKALKEWRDWLVKKGLEPDLSPEGVIEIFSTMKTCLEMKKSIDELTQRIGIVQAFVEDHERRVSSVSEGCGRERKEGATFLMEMQRLNEDLEEALENKKKSDNLSTDGKKLDLEIQNLKKKVKDQEKRIDEILSQGFAKSETEFRGNAKNWEERKELEDDILRAEQNIKRITGDGKPYVDFLNELKESTLEFLKERKAKVDEVLNELNEAHSELGERRGGIKKEIEQIERREEGSSLRMERAVKMRNLERKSHEWYLLALASTILRKAIEKYEQERQPGVIKEAQTFFSKITHGRYPRIYAPLGEATIYVEDERGERKSIQELSRGTAEQLYLSLRFGFIREFGKRAESLPVVFDDILVNFDPERFKAACSAIKELAKTNQILYFTCHPETVDSLTSAISDSKVTPIEVI